MKIIVIGSGMAGLTAGAYLSKAGHSVQILEQHDQPGGVTATVGQDGFHWDLGPLLLEGFGPGDLGRIILEELGVSDMVTTIREDRGLAFPDFSLWHPEVYGGPDWRQRKLEAMFPEEVRNIRSYYRFYNRMLDLVTIAKKLEEETGFIRLIDQLKLWLAFQFVKGKEKLTAQSLMEQTFQRSELRALFPAIVADFVTKPSEFSALGVPMIHLETAFDKRIACEPGEGSARFGFFYVVGGCQNLVKAAMHVITTHGGTIETGRTVSRILTENGRVSGVRLQDGSDLRADLVLASGGQKETFYQLLGNAAVPRDLCTRIDRNTFMESVFMVHLGINVDPSPHQPAALCYYYGSYDLEAGIDKVRHGIYHEGADGFVVYVPSMHSPMMAPPGHHAVTIYTIAPNTLRSGDWSVDREYYADRLVHHAEKFILGLSDATQTRVIMTPIDFQKRTHQIHHSFGGLPPVLGNKAPDHKTPIPGLWFIGSQSESGGGVQNVMVGARKVARRIIQGEGW